MLSSVPQFGEEQRTLGVEFFVQGDLGRMKPAKPAVIREYGLPPEYVEPFAKTPAEEHSNSRRPSKLEAEEALRRHEAKRKQP